MDKSIDAAGLDAIAKELCQLLQEQIETITARKFNDLTDAELDAYGKRKARILELRSELQKFVRPT
jgi:hypothetical protein